jgi:hypothetical protein
MLRFAPIRKLLLRGGISTGASLLREYTPHLVRATLIFDTNVTSVVLLEAFIPIS